MLTAQIKIDWVRHDILAKTSERIGVPQRRPTWSPTGNFNCIWKLWLTIDRL